MTIDAREWRGASPADVRSLIERSGLTQHEVAKRLGVTFRTIQYWLSETSTQRKISYVAWLALRQLAAKP